MLVRMQTKENPLTLLVGMQAGAATVETNMKVPQKVKNRATLQPSNCTARDLPQRCRCSDPKGHLHPIVQIAAMFKIAKLWQDPRCPLADKWIKM